MSHALKIRLIGITLLAVATVGVFWFEPFISIWAHKIGSPVQAASSLPYNEFANGPYTVQGNAILGADGQRYLFHGIGRDGLGYTCNGDGFFDAQHPALMRPSANTSSGTNWHPNTPPLSISDRNWSR